MGKSTLMGQKIAYSREKIGYSKKDLAQAFGVSPSTITKYEKGLTMPSVITLYIISILADMPMDSFVDETFSLEEFIEMSQKSLAQRFIEVHNKIVKELSHNKKDTSQ